MRRKVRVVVPGSTSNLGPAFDLVGLAVDVYLRATVEAEGEFVMAGTGSARWEVAWEGEGSGPTGRVPEGEENLLVRGVQAAWAEAGLTFEGRVGITARSEIPVSRGLGSSAAAVVAGLLAGDRLADSGIGPERLIALAASEEGHPDNAAPSVMGGLTAAAPGRGEGILVRRQRLHEDFLLAAVVPDTELSTRMAREALPSHIPHPEAVRNQQRAFFLYEALSEGWGEELRELTRDALHQSYRAPLIPGFEQIVDRALEEGALAAWLSGGGPAVMILSDEGPDRLEEIGASMQGVWREGGMASRVLLLGPDDVGGTARAHPSSSEGGGSHLSASGLTEPGSRS
ncbi:MAG: homoserine kinase [bacterium]